MLEKDICFSFGSSVGLLVFEASGDTQVFQFLHENVSNPVSCVHLLSVCWQNEIHGLIEKYSVNESLVEEIEKLKEENRRLKANY